MSSVAAVALFTAAYSPVTSEFCWFGTASPQRPDVTGKRFFFVNHAGVVCYSNRKFDVDPNTCNVPEGLVPVGR